MAGADLSDTLMDRMVNKHTLNFVDIYIYIYTCTQAKLDFFLDILGTERGESDKRGSGPIRSYS